jgi:Fe2+ transport system protein B
MEKEIIETVLIEVLEEQKQTSQCIEQNNKLLQGLDEKLKQQHKAFSESVATSLNTLKKDLCCQAQPVKREFRILLFPEHGTLNYYKVVFGRIFFWLVILCIAKYAYLLGDKWISKRLEISRYQRAWEAYYLQQNKKGQKAMEQILNESSHDQ